MSGGKVPTPQGERIAALEQRVADHESRCEERLGEIKTSTAATLRAVDSLKNRFWVIALAMLAWALAQLWAGVQARIAVGATVPSAAVAHLDSSK